MWLKLLTKYHFQINYHFKMFSSQGKIRTACFLKPRGLCGCNTSLIFSRCIIFQQKRVFFFFSFSFFSSHTRVPIKSSPLMELKVCKLCAMWCELSPCLCLQVMVRALHAEWSNDSKSMSLDYGASFVEMENWLGWCLTCHSLNKIYVVAVRFRSSGANLIVKPFFFFFACFKC